MAHLKKSAITGHLLKNAAGHLVLDCRTTTEGFVSTTTSAPVTTTMAPVSTTSLMCPEDSYCEDTCLNAYTLIMAPGLMVCNPCAGDPVVCEDCDGTYTMVDGTACQWTGNAPVSPCYGNIYCSSGYWVAQVTCGLSMEQCEWQKPAYNNSCPPGTYSFNATGSTCATCPANVTIT